MNYVELHCRSAFSFLRGASTPEALAERAAELQMPAVALCDRDGVYGAPWFFTEARKLGIRPIVGAELTMEDQTILPVLVQSRAGYENLCQLLTRAHLRNEKGKCSVQWNELPEFADGLVALMGNFPTARRNTRLESPVNPQTGKSALQTVEELRNIFGQDNLFIEIRRHRIRGEERANKARIDLAHHLRLPLLATNGVLYATENERPVLDVFSCIRNHTHLDAAGTLLEQNGEHHLKTAAQMCELFHDLPEAITNTVRLAERLDFTLENLGYEFPAFAVPAGYTMDS